MNRENDIGGIRDWKDALAMCACYALTYGPMLALLAWVVCGSES